MILRARIISVYIAIVIKASSNIRPPLSFLQPLLNPPTERNDISRSSPFSPACAIHQLSYKTRISKVIWRFSHVYRPQRHLICPRIIPMPPPTLVPLYFVLKLVTPGLLTLILCRNDLVYTLRTILESIIAGRVSEVEV